MQGLTFQLKSHETEPIDTVKMYENLMTDVGPKDWSTNFNHDVFYNDDTEGYLNWSKNFQSGYMFRNLGNKMFTLTIKQNACFRIIVAHICSLQLLTIWIIKE